MYTLIMLTALGAAPGAAQAPQAAPQAYYRPTAQQYYAAPTQAFYGSQNYYGRQSYFAGPGCCPTDDVDLFLPCPPLSPCAPFAPSPTPMMTR